MPFGVPDAASYLAVSLGSAVVGSYFGESRPEPDVFHCHCSAEHTEHHDGSFAALVNGVVRFSIGCLGVSLAWYFYRISQPIVAPARWKSAGAVGAARAPFLPSSASGIEFTSCKQKVGDFEPEAHKPPQSLSSSQGPITRSNRK